MKQQAILFPDQTVWSCFGGAVDPGYAIRDQEIEVVFAYVTNTEIEGMFARPPITTHPPPANGIYRSLPTYEPSISL